MYKMLSVTSEDEADAGAADDAILIKFKVRRILIAQCLCMIWNLKSKIVVFFGLFFGLFKQEICTNKCI